MYIKGLTINNFKSYHGCTTIQDIKPCHNILVGENGSGKSNLLHAIEFVLNYENKKTSRANIITLLSHRASEGFVEILFSGCEPPLEFEFTLRKEFSLISNIKFYFNNVLMNHKMITMLSEIYGISFNLPFIIISPLMVQRFATFSRKDMLSYVIKNMGPTIHKTYKFIQEIFVIFEGQKEKIDHIFDFFNEVNLAEDKKYSLKLKKYKIEKNAILSNILKRRIHKWTLIKKQLQENLRSLKEHHVDDTASSDLSMLQYSHSQVVNMMADKKVILDDLLEEKCHLLKNKEKLNLSKRDMKQTIETINKITDESEDYTKSIHIDHQVMLLSKELEIVCRELKAKEEVVTKLDLQRELKKEERLNLLLKIKRTKEFSTKEERNTHLQTEINLLSKKIENIEEEVKFLANEKNKLSKNKAYLHNKIDKLQKEADQHDQINQKIFQEKQQLNSLLNEKSDLRRKEKIIEDEISEITQNLQEEALRLKKKIGHAVIIGAESILTIVEACKFSETHRRLFNSYLGMVIENFECSEDLSIAVETAIGNRLFSHIITNNQAGTMLLKEMNNNKLLGEVYFLPVENLQEFSVDYPSLEGAELLLSRIKFKPELERVMKFLFGRTMICKNINIAINIARQYRGLTCVTVEGDKVSNSVISGGYFHKLKCSRTLFFNINHQQNALSLKSEEFQHLTNKMNNLETGINSAISSIQQLTKLRYLSSNNGENLNHFIEEEHCCDKEFLAINETILKNKNIVHRLSLKKSLLVKELSEEFEKINKDVTARITNLNNEIEEANKYLEAKVVEQIMLESKKIRLEDNLKHQRLLKNNVMIDSSEIKKCHKKILENELKENVVNNRLSIIRNKIEETKNSINELTSEKLKIEEEIKEQLEMSFTIGNKEKVILKLMNCDKKLNEYRSEFNVIECHPRFSNKYKNLTTPALHEELKLVDKVLEEAFMANKIEKKKKKINRLYQDYEQLLNSFSYNCLLYTEFIDWFHNYVYRSLNDISGNFTETFESLTFGGEGNLFLDDDGSLENWPALENATGLQMCVKFSNSGECWDLLSLSSSQKVLAMMSLAFSITKFIPVPLYLLDEIERPLTGDQKNELCHKISEFGDSLQTFSSSHSQEWMRFGNCLYHITFKFMRSNARKLSEIEVSNLIAGILVSKIESFTPDSGLDSSSSINFNY